MTRAEACPHKANVRDCGECGAEAHKRAVSRATALSMGAASGDAQAITEAVLDRAIAAQMGHRILRENGIPPLVDWDSRPSLISCQVCGAPNRPGDVCRNPRCTARPIRFELPEGRR